MARLTIRYHNGETDSWIVHERMQADKLLGHLFHGLARGQFITVAVEAEAGSEIDYGVIGLRMGDVAMFHLDGYVDEERLLSVWQPQDEDPTAEL